MSILGRVFNGVTRALTAPLRAAITPFTFAFNMLKTGVATLGKLATLDLGGAASTLIGGTISNTVRAGVNLAQGGMPLLAFAEGAGMNKSGIGLT